MKKRVKLILLTLLVWFVMYYIALPPINIQAQEFWQFCVAAVVVAAVINMWSILKGITITRHGIQGGNGKAIKGLFIVVLGFGAVFLIGSLLSSPIIRAKAYRELIQVQESDFKQDIHEVDYSQIPILDRDSASKLSERKMGSMIDMVSQYEVSDFFTQINYQQKPMRVTPLEYGNEIKWLTNRKTGIPAYIRIDMTTQNVELVKLEQGIKISPSEHFGRNLQRYLRFRYPTAMFSYFNFEIDDDGTPYWIAPVETKRIGLFGGTDIKGIVALNAITGEDIYYKVEEVPQWIDNVYNADILIRQYNYYGTLVNGYLNSIFGQRGCLQSTEGYNYIALNDDVWVYTGITSVGGDESNVGFILMNQRTKETKYYPISGAKEISAMSSAEGQVQHLGYKATFPLLLNVGGEPTYFLALKDGAGLVKKYAMVNIEKYQIVAIGDSVSDCEKAYRSLMVSSGIETVNTTDAEKISGVILERKEVVIDGNTHFYFVLDNSNLLFEAVVKDNLNVLKWNEGDLISIEYVDSDIEGISTILKIE